MTFLKELSGITNIQGLDLNLKARQSTITHEECTSPAVLGKGRCEKDIKLNAERSKGTKAEFEGRKGCVR